MLQLVILALAATSFVSGQEWTQIPGGLKHISGSISYVWGVNSGKHVYFCQRPCNGRNWKHTPGSLVQLDVDDHEVWGVNAHDGIFMRPIDASCDWKQIPGKLIHVSASGNGYIWGVNRANHIFKCKKPCTGLWVHVGGGLKQIDGGQRAVYGVNKNNDIYSRPVDGSGGWRHIPGNKLKHISASGTYEVYGVNNADQIFRCKKPCIGEWELLSGRLKQCDATANALLGVNKNDHIFRRNFPL